MIFLAGSIRGEWQDGLKEEIRGLRGDVHIYDPREHLMHDPRKYTKQDLDAITESNIVIAVVQDDMKNWASIAFQLGFARALGKRVLLVNAHGAQSAHNVHQCCDVFPDLDSLMAALPLMEEFLQ